MTRKEQHAAAKEMARRNGRLLAVTLLAVFVMVGVSFASVPLYRMLCQVTGWGGTTRTVAENPFQAPTARTITVRFDSNVAQGMPWRFRPDVRSVTIPAGADGFMSFVAENPTGQAITGTAVYNVTPFRAGRYFHKTQCFCFDEQVLAPRQRVNMPVVFFVDPAIFDDPETRDIEEITLSYTFFRANTPDLERAIERYKDGVGAQERDRIQG